MQAWIATAALICLPVGSACAQPAAAAPAQPKAVTAQAEVACPSQNFKIFLDAFADSAAVQRKFTQLPIEYGQLDMALVGTDREDEAVRKRVIHKFESIPLFDRKGGRIFRSKRERKQGKLELRTELHPGTATVVMYLPDSGFHIYFRFRRTQRCWFLYAISDEST